MVLHRLIDIHGVEAWNVKASQPHIAHDDNFQWIIFIFHTLCKHFSLLFSSMVFLHFRTIRTGRCHNNFDSTLVQIVTMPLRAKLYDFIIQINSDSTAHRNNHRLTLKNLLAILKMRNNVFCESGKAFFIPDNSLQLCPFHFCGFCFVFFIYFFKFPVELLNQLFAFLGEVDFSQTAFIIYFNCHLIFNRLGNIVNINVIAKYRRRVGILLLYRCTGKTYESSVWQGIAHIFGKTISYTLPHNLIVFVLYISEFRVKAVLRAVRFIGYNNYVVSFRQKLINRAVIIRYEFLNSGKNYASGCYL